MRHSPCLPAHQSFLKLPPTPTTHTHEGGSDHDDKYNSKEQHPIQSCHQANKDNSLNIFPGIGIGQGNDQEEILLIEEEDPVKGGGGGNTKRVRPQSIDVVNYRVVEDVED